MSRQRLASPMVVSILSPLPPLSHFAEDAGGGGEFGKPHARRGSDAGLAECESGKRARRVEHPVRGGAAAAAASGGTRLPADVAQAVDAVRRAGAPADTLFFPALPADFERESALRAALGAAVRDLKLLRPAGKRPLAWASFFNEADAVARLVALRREHPALRARLHTPRAGGGTAGPGVAAVASAATSPTHGAAAVREAFDARAQKIVAEGGVADTVMLRGVPLEVSVDEITDVVSGFHPNCRPLRARTSEGKSGKVRNFWLSYSDREAARIAFVLIHGRTASFMCGKQQRIMPVVHNDATDGESKTRRGREAALGDCSRPVGPRAAGRSFDASPRSEPMDLEAAGLEGGEDVGYSAVDRLEMLLRQKPGRHFFLDQKSFL